METAHLTSDSQNTDLVGRAFTLFHSENSNEKFTNAFKVPIPANCRDVRLQNTRKFHSYHLKIWRLL